MTHSSNPQASTALGQCHGGLYAYRPKVATQRRDLRPVISLQCVANHKSTLKLEFLSSGLRYPTRCRSWRSNSSGQLTQERALNPCWFPQRSSVRSHAFLTNRRRPSCAEYGLSKLIATNPLQFLVNEMQEGPDVGAQESDQRKQRPELPCSHTSLLRLLLDYRQLGISSFVGLFDAAMVLRHSQWRTEPTDAPVVTASTLASAVREHGSFAHAASKQQTPYSSDNSDFHLRLLPNSAGSYVPPLFLAESHFTGRTPQSASSNPCCAAVGGSMSAPRIPRDRELTFGQMLAMVVTVGAVLYGAGYLLVSWIWT